MKQIITCILFLGVVTLVLSQPLPDSIKAKYNAAKTDAAKGRYLTTYLKLIRNDSSFLKKILVLNNYFKNQDDEVGQDYIESAASSHLSYTGDFTTALNRSLQLLSRFEKRHDDYGKMQAYQQVGFALEQSGDIEQAITYYKKVITIARLSADKKALSQASNSIGSAFALLNLPDSGLVYAQQSVAYDYEINDSAHLCYSLGTLGENYITKKEYDLAIPFIKRSYELSKSYNDLWTLTWALNDLAQIFLETNRYDSARYYARQAVELAGEKGFKDQVLRAYEYLYRCFEKTDIKDSVYKYFRLAGDTKDSLFTLQKAKEVQAINFREQMRQQEIENEKTKAEEVRKTNIQYALIALGIFVLLTLYLSLSRSFITNTKMIEFLGVIALLIVFEFLNLLLHPFLERITNHSPVLMLLALVCIAALLVPLHHKLEKWATTKLVEKNKQIRLVAAKKTIEELEKN